MRSEEFDFVIIGAGLAGVTISNQLSILGFTVLLLETGEGIQTYSDNKYYSRDKSNLLFTRGMGDGGTTNFWHSGFLRISKKIDWINITIGDEWYIAAKKYLNIPDNACCDPNEIYYPKKRYIANSISSVILRVGVGGIRLDPLNSAINFVSSSESNSVKYKKLVLCAGGIGTPLLLKSEVNSKVFKSDLIGKNFTDHISCALLKVKLRKWEFIRFAFGCGAGVVKKGVVVKDHIHGLDHIFFPRPVLSLRSPPHTQVLRREIVGLFGTKRYLQCLFLLLTHFDLMLEALLYKCSFKLPCRYIQYNVVSEQVEINQNSVYLAKDGLPVIQWSVSDVEKSAIDNAVDILISELGSKIIAYEKFKITEDNYTMCCHHSGTMRMSFAEGEGVVNSDCQMIGFENVYVCDGSVLPKTSYANTGLTIVALALRLVQHLSNSLSTPQSEKS